MYTLYLTNFGYASGETFDTLDAALAGARARCFQVQVYCRGELVATWCPISGTRIYAWAS